MRTKMSVAAALAALSLSSPVLAGESAVDSTGTPAVSTDQGGALAVGLTIRNGQSGEFLNANVTPQEGKAAVANIGRKIGYISAVHRAVDEKTQSVSTSVETGVVNDGVSATVAAKRVPGDRYLVNLSVAQANLRAMRNFQSGDTIIQLPEVEATWHSKFSFRRMVPLF